MLIFGGFDGRLKSDVLVYVVGVCTSLTTKEHCLTAMPGVKCVWNKAAKKCEPLASVSKEGYEKCPGLCNAKFVFIFEFTIIYNSFCFSINSGDDKRPFRMVFLSLADWIRSQFNISMWLDIQLPNVFAYHI